MRGRVASVCQLQHGEPPAAGVAYGVQRPARAAVVHRDEDGGSVDHVSVSPLHAARGIAVLEHGACVAHGEQAPVARLRALRPEPVLIQTGHRRLQRDAAALCAQGEHRLGEVHVAAERHSADKMPRPAVVKRVEHVADAALERRAAPVALVVAPGQLGRPVPAEAAGLDGVRGVHCSHAPKNTCPGREHFCSGAV